MPVQQYVDDPNGGFSCKEADDKGDRYLCGGYAQIEAVQIVDGRDP